MHIESAHQSLTNFGDLWGRSGRGEVSHRDPHGWVYQSETSVISRELDIDLKASASR